MIDFSYDYESIKFKASTREELLKLYQAIKSYITDLSIKVKPRKKTIEIKADPLQLEALHSIAKAIKELSSNNSFNNPNVKCFFMAGDEMTICSEDLKNLEILVESIKSIIPISYVKVNDKNITFHAGGVHPILIQVVNQFIRIADLAL